MAMAASLGTGFLKSDPALDRPDISSIFSHLVPITLLMAASFFGLYSICSSASNPESTGHIERNQQIWKIIQKFTKLSFDENRLRHDCSRVEDVQICRTDPVKSMIARIFPSKDIADDDDALYLIAHVIQQRSPSNRHV